MQELFVKCDKDGNGRINLEEFVSHYLDTKDKLVERESELKKNIIDSHKKKQEAEENLALAKRDQPNVTSAGFLTVTLINAENLAQNAKAQVTLYQGINMLQAPTVAQGPNPSFPQDSSF